MKPNILFFLTDELRAQSLPLYGEQLIETPHISRFASQSTTFTQAISSCPVCVPYRSMLMTGRHPQTTGHLVNFVRTRHDEIGMGDVFGHAGYRTGYVGKWHLHTGSFPQIQGRDYVPEGRDRLGFDYWRAYNFHMNYFDGWIHTDHWKCERWRGYETHALGAYAKDFITQTGDEPFCLVVSPHQPHESPLRMVPDEYYDKVPEALTLPSNVPEDEMEQSLEAYRHYLAMILAIDDMFGQLMNELLEAGKAENTIVVFTSDHGAQMGAHGISPWAKKMPYEESIHVPLIVRWPGILASGATCDALTSPVDYLPTLCGLCDVPVPRTVEGMDLSKAWLGQGDAVERDAVLTMNFNREFDYLMDGMEWRGIRTKTTSYCRWLEGRIECFDIERDPLQTKDLSCDSSSAELVEGMERTLEKMLAERSDRFMRGSSYEDWYDAQRRVVKNATGSLGCPEAEPDWSLLNREKTAGG